MPSIDYIKDRSAWTPEILNNDQSWKYHFTGAELAEIDQALTQCKYAKIPLHDINQTCFPLFELKRTLNHVSEYLEHDRGVMVLKGLPVEKYSKSEIRTIYLGIGAHIGLPLRQSIEGEIIQDVYNKGENLYADSGRGTNSSNKLPWHTDRSDVVSLLCVSRAAQGGESKLASLTNLYNKIKQERPDLAEVLCKPFFHGRAPFERNDAQPWYSLPIFTEYEGKFASRYLRRFIETAQELAEVPRFSTLQIEALDYVDQRLEADDVCLNLPFEVGDIQFINNFTICHSRNEYVDQGAQSRFLLRLWLAAYNGRNLAPAFSPLYGETQGGGARGGILF